MPLGRIVAAYPTLPFLATTLLEFITPAGYAHAGHPDGMRARASGRLWLVAFRRLGLPLSARPLIILLLALHPAVLRAAIAGPAEMMLAVFLFLLGDALLCFARPQRGARSDGGRAVAARSCLLASDGGGARLRGDPAVRIRRAARNAGRARYSIRSSPCYFRPSSALRRFSYMSWVFPGSGWSFLVAPAEGYRQLGARGFSLPVRPRVDRLARRSTPASPWSSCCCSPRPWCRWRIGLGLAAPAAGRSCTGDYDDDRVAAAGIAVLTGLFGDPAALAVMPPMLAALVIIRLPLVRERLAVVLPLLVLGWFGGLAGLVHLSIRAARSTWGSRSRAASVDVERLAAINLGNATVGHDGVLVDTLQLAGHRARARGRSRPADAIRRCVRARRAAFAESIRRLSPFLTRMSASARRTG